jgi:hypothetical protein
MFRIIIIIIQLIMGYISFKTLNLRSISIKLHLKIVLTLSLSDMFNKEG